MAQGITGTVLTSNPAEIGLFQGKLDYATTTSVKLNPNKGRYVEVDGYLMDIAASLTLTTTDNRIDSSGADAAAAMTTSTLYYVYVGNSVASYGPGSLRASTVAPTLLDGVKYLGTTGNARNWRFVGWVRTNGSTQFTDSDTSRLVVSYYNRKRARMFSCPAYSDGNTTTTWTANSTSWAAANAGTGNTLVWIDNGEDAAIFSALMGVQSVASQYCQLGIDVNAAGTATSPQRIQNGSASQYGNNKVSYLVAPSEGYRTGAMSYRTTSAVSYTVEADEQRNGASVDPAKTYIEAEVMI